MNTEEIQKDEWSAYMNSIWSAAIQYTSMGWSVIPLLLSTKTPAVPWTRYQTEIVDEETITDWVTNGVPDGNGGYTKAFGLAVVTGKLSGIVVVDCDNQDAATYAINEMGLFSTFTCKTTRGMHMYFKHPGFEVRNKAGGTGRDWPDVAGLDLRGDGGYVVAPPTVKFGPDGKLVHTYMYSVPFNDVEYYVDSIPAWPGVKIKQTEKREIKSVDEWTFDNIDLASVTAVSATVWDDAARLCKQSGRKIREGEGRNAWITRYLGECIASDMDQSQARVAGMAFQEEFFEHFLPDAEFETTLASVISSDRRNHPEKYEEMERIEKRNPARAERLKSVSLITPANLREIRKAVGSRQFFIDPFIPVQSIVQVVGFNGHGKSLTMLNMLFAAAKGMSFGPAHVDAKTRVLYLDYESSTNTLIDRLDSCEQMLGPMSDDMMIYNTAHDGQDMNLRDSESLEKLQELLSEIKPHIVVIDTVRSAFAGMEENSPHSWTHVNKLAVAIRNCGCAVVLIHHRNKPGQDGRGGREAGSTAQLKDLDTQIFVTKVVLDSDQAQREAALPDVMTKVQDSAGNQYTAWNYLTLSLTKDSQLKMVFELSFGKLRQATENHVVTYIGLAENKKTGEWQVVSSLTPKQKTLRLAAAGMSIEDIAGKLQVSQPTVKRWLKPTENQE